MMALNVLCKRMTQQIASQGPCYCFQKICLGASGGLLIGGTSKIQLCTDTDSDMKAIQVSTFGGPDVMKTSENLEIPRLQSGDQVLVRLAYAGVNPVDTYIRAGVHSIRPPLPHTPGSDGAGTVQELGSDVTGLKVGQRVLVAPGPDGRPGGTYASHVVAPASCVSPLPDRLSFQQGASVGIPYYTAWHALVQRAGAKKGDSVLVHGASGGVGLAAVQIGKHLGLTVFGTAGRKEGLQLVQEQGADQVFNHRTPGYAEQIALASGGGVDIVLEMLANVNLNTDLDLLKFRGRVVVVGNRGSITINPRATMAKESSILGCALLLSTREDWADMRSAIAEGLEGGWMIPRVEREYPLEQAPQAHVDIINTTGARGNLVLRTE